MDRAAGQKRGSELKTPFHIRRPLNLNQFSTVFLKLIVLFIIVIPAGLYGILLFLNTAGNANIFRLMSRISFAIGASIFVTLLILVIVEQIQDHYIDVQYWKNRSRKLPLADGNYECQYCGNQKVKESDKACRVCGQELKPV